MDKDEIVIAMQAEGLLRVLRSSAVARGDESQAQRHLAAAESLEAMYLDAIAQRALSRHRPPDT